MAVRPTRNAKDRGNDRTWLVAASLLVLFVAALFLRAYWNIDAAHPAEDVFVLSGGSDPYYHKRAVDYIQANGFQTLFHDPLLNYPFGAINPNPPLYEWSVAVAGLLLDPVLEGGLDTATWWAIVWSPAIYSALTTIPIFFIAAALFDRRAGLVAALLWVISTSAIDTGGLGDADHDSAIMFFASFAFLFYIKTIQHFRGQANWVTRWGDGSAVSSGLGRLFAERKAGFAYALLSAVGVGAVALIWKGFPYVLGIMVIYAVLQMILDHWTNRDSTGLFLATFLVMVLGTLIAYPYYAAADLGNFLRPVWFLIGGFFLAGAVLVPTRDLPTILVMPAALVAAALLGVVAFVVAPDIARSLLYATVYFKQTALYQTIAEAHPADFSTIVFGVGPVPFFLALFGWFTLLFNVRRHPSRAALFALTWGAVALFMATSAVRFLFNAIPVFVVLAGFMTVWLIDWLDFGTIRKSMAGNPGWAGFRKGVRTSQVVFVVLVAFLFVFPNVLLAADAALPPEAENRIAQESDSEFVQNFVTQRLGAYGQGFIPDYWKEGLDWLAAYDAEIADPAERPAFLSWWDYGHWAIEVGEHPAVADNFQNGYEFAANFILAQNETHAIQLLAARLAPLPEADLVEVLRDMGVEDPIAVADQLLSWRFVDELSTEQSVELLLRLEENTGKRIRYFAADVRMLPLDDPQTPSIEQSSIFYAPVVLKGDDPDEYITTMINTGDRLVTQEEYEQLASDPIRQVAATGERLQYQPQFFQTMYWRTYVGAPAPTQQQGPILGDAVFQALNQPQPTAGLQHFRLVYANDALKIIEFSPGATVTGVVTEDGTPLEGVTVTAFDDAGELVVGTFREEVRGQVDPTDFNVPHARDVTNEQGRFELTVPFGNVTLVANRGGVEVGRANVDISREEAAQRATIEGIEITLERGTVEGVVFEDANGDGVFDETNETAVSNVTVAVGGKTATTGAEGAYRIEDVSAGVQNVTVEGERFEVVQTSSRVRVQPGEVTTHNIGVRDKAGTIEGALFADIDGDGQTQEGETLPNQQLTFTAAPDVEGNQAVNRTVMTGPGGAFGVQLRPGTYLVEAEYTDPVNGGTFAIEERIEVGIGETLERDFVLTRQES